MPLVVPWQHCQGAADTDYPASSMLTRLPAGQFPDYAKLAVA
jgi:hypothetical protein